MMISIISFLNAVCLLNVLLIVLISIEEMAKTIYFKTEWLAQIEAGCNQLPLTTAERPNA
jgi:hypothetical protein